MQSSRLRQLQYVLAFIAMSFAVAIGPLRHFLAFAYNTGDQSYILLIPVLCAILIYRDQNTFLAEARSGWSAGAVSFLTAGIATLILAYFLNPASELQMAACAIGLISCWVGGFIYAFGTKCARAAVFPLGMLLWIIPIPAVCIAWITNFLQVGSTELVAVLFQATGTPVLRDGFFFHLSTQSIEVAKECSGIRSSLCLILLTLIIAHESLRGNWRRAVLVLSTIPIVILKNGVRIVTLTLLAVHVDPSFLTGRLHHEGGIVFFLIGMALLVPLIALLRLGEKSVSQPTASRAATAQ